jgi:NADH-quinone oxidoreductase subunit L
VAVFLNYAWLIPVFPLLACVIITLTPLQKNKRASGWLAIGMMGLAVLFALGVLLAVLSGVYVDAQGQVVPPPAAEAAHSEDTHSEGEGAHGEGAHGEGAHGGPFAFQEPNAALRFLWIPTGNDVFETGIYIDGLTAAILVMVTITSGCIHLFSMGYMAASARQARFFAFIALFTAAMLAMCLAGDLLVFFMAWEIMGLCSYLLIGFLYERPTAYRAAVKAFITTRIGDVLMLIGMVYWYAMAGSLEFGMGEGQLFHAETLARLAAETNALGLSHATTIALLIFAGTVGKAAQFPLHVWLPDAMEGPTPVSALIHAATMVSAGVFLVGRVYPIFTADGGIALFWVSFIGALTALFASTIACAQFDIKRILAYSTLSQLGFMVAALGVGGWVAGMFHLLTHAFFKALLFLGSGSVIHAMEETPAIEKLHHHDEYAAQQTAQDIRNMGNLREFMPQTYLTYTAGYLALAGIIPFAGFWSKDEILASALATGHWVVYGVLTVAAFLTAFYMTRQWRAVFWGSYRGADPRVWQRDEAAEAEHAASHGHAEHSEHHEHGHAEQREHDEHGAATPRESDWTMVRPLQILGIFAIAGGLLNVPGIHWLSDFWEQPGEPLNLFVITVEVVALVIAVAGIAAGWFYGNAFRSAHDEDPFETHTPGLFALLNRAYHVDAFYARTVGRLSDGLTVAWRWLDRSIIDRIVNGVGSLTLFLGRINFLLDDAFFNDGPDTLAKGTRMAGDDLRYSQTGKVQDYVGFVFVGIVVLALIFLYGLSN